MCELMQQYVSDNDIDKYKQLTIPFMRLIGTSIPKCNWSCAFIPKYI